MTTTATAPVGVSKEHVTKTPGVCGGRACIAGTRIRVMDVVLHHRAGLTPAEIAAVWENVSVADVYAALAYAHDFADDVAAEFRHERETAEKCRPATPTKYTLVRDALAGG